MHHPPNVPDPTSLSNRRSGAAVDASVVTARIPQNLHHLVTVTRLRRIIFVTPLTVSALVVAAINGNAVCFGAGGHVAVEGTHGPEGCPADSHEHDGRASPGADAPCGETPCGDGDCYDLAPDLDLLRETGAAAADWTGVAPSRAVLDVCPPGGTHTFRASPCCAHGLPAPPAARASLRSVFLII